MKYTCSLSHTRHQVESDAASQGEEEEEEEEGEGDK
jgi:hypothetical protein